MTIKEAREHVAYWKGTLGLSDWNISIEFVKLSLDRCADVEISYRNRDAKIRIVPNNLRKKKQQVVLKNHEVDIVHELLHIWVDTHWKTRSKTSDLKKEMFIEAMARTLVSLRYGTPGAFFGNT